MKGLTRIAAALGALLLVCACPAWAWGPQGHRTVGAIADRLLDPRARAAVADLLQGDLDRDGNPSHRTTLEAVSTWADEIRGTPASHPSWHYDNRPVCGSASRAQYCPDGQCNTVQLERMIAVVAERSAAHRERNEALKWIVHLVGDIHQPLHAADNDDRGGNEVPVVLAGMRARRRLDLHEVWDDQLVRLALRTRSTRRPPSDIAALAAAARRLARARGEGTPESWARESNRLAREVAYRYPQFACHRTASAAVVLDADYQRAAERVVREQLLLAGARLAALLNRILAPPQSVHGASEKHGAEREEQRARRVADRLQRQALRERPA